MAPTVTSYEGNSRLRRVRAAAALAGVELIYDSSFTFKSDWKTPEFLQKFPLGYQPTLEDGDFYLQESSAIAEYVATLAPNSTVVPSDKKQLALCHQWQCFADQEIYMKHNAASTIINGSVPYNKVTYQFFFDKLVSRLETLEKILADKTFLVGERITIADICVATALTNVFSGLVDKSIRAKLPNTLRYLDSIVKHPKLIALFDNGDLKFTDEPVTPAQPAKEAKPAKESKPAEPKAPKATKAPKAKEADEEEEEPLVPAEPKVKNPLDDLPKSTFNLEEWKRQYSNLDTRGEALPWFYQNFDKEGFSIWRVDFKYNEELTQTFMSNNQIGGFFNRLEASRKYLFGSMGVLGKTNDSIISGALIVRGKDVKPVVDVAPDWESYEYKEISLDNEEDKKFFEGAMAWDLEMSGKSWVDGKNFK
ncbi:hypothetical protein BD324DRAFT_55327 [Kockovaella imperatae]|uniref:Elongation factor 1-gamma n=1 Tax=Kockovaella imperatae TaxID=4999 RepID=A0A1Y1UTD8_9TREE|nr:hypothetical protein BD324DRAFT_55327 [Kockovaella imperatae]ORX41290.1 hypothetical protein BD324DRAFT_55327 [Kockovaella imperatae]